jgi:C4-type Zn-finger protein
MSSPHLKPAITKPGLAQKLGTCPLCDDALEAILAFRDVGFWGLQMDEVVPGVGFCRHCVSLVKDGRVVA